METVASLSKMRRQWRDRDFLPLIAAAQIAARQDHDAFQTVDRLELAWRHRALLAVASAQTQTGQPQLAPGDFDAGFATRIGNRRYSLQRTLTLRKIANRQRQAGDATNAHATLGKIQHDVEGLKGTEFDCAFVLRNLAVGQWGVGDARAAVATMQQAAQHLKKIPDKVNRAGALLYIARAWENLGEYQFAFNAAEMIPAEEGKDMVWDRGEAFFELAKRKSARATRRQRWARESGSASG